jgi:hypothetical protein
MGMKSGNGELVLDYHVHHVITSKQPTTVMLMGKEVVADVEGREIALTSERPEGHGSLTLRFIGPELDDIAGIFESDGDVELVLRRKNGPPPAIEEAAPLVVAGAAPVV